MQLKKFNTRFFLKWYGFQEIKTEQRHWLSHSKERKFILTVKQNNIITDHLHLSDLCTGKVDECEISCLFPSDIEFVEGSHYLCFHNLFLKYLEKKLRLFLIFLSFGRS